MMALVNATMVALILPTLAPAPAPTLAPTVVVPAVPAASPAGHGSLGYRGAAGPARPAGPAGPGPKVVAPIGTLDEDLSPVTLATDWSKVSRLILLATMSVVGSVGNVFLISSILIEEHLSKRGNAFVVNVALADLLVTGLVFPASAVVILAGMRDLEAACNFHWIVAILCCLVTTLTFMFIALENLMRLCLPPTWYEHVTPAKITVLIFIIWIVSGVVVGLQTALPLGPDYCHRNACEVPRPAALPARCHGVLRAGAHGGGSGLLYRGPGPRAHRQARARLQAPCRLLLGLLAHEDQLPVFLFLRGVLAAVRHGAGAAVHQHGLTARAVPAGVVRAQQVLPQQLPVLPDQPALPQRLRQPVPLLLLQDDRLAGAAPEARGVAAHGGRPGAHHPGLQHVLVHVAAARAGDRGQTQRAARPPSTTQRQRQAQRPRSVRAVGCWRLLGVAGGSWGLLEAAVGYCRLLEASGGCWR